MSDHDEIMNALGRYARGVDERDFASVAALFTSDADIDYSVGGGAVLKAGELAAWLGRAMTIFRMTQHHLGLPVIDVDGDTATCVSYLAVVMEHEDVPVMRVFGRYRDRLVRGDDGRWRFREGIAEIESMRAGLPPFVDGRPGQA